MGYSGFLTCLSSGGLYWRLVLFAAAGDELPVVSVAPAEDGIQTSARCRARERENKNLKWSPWHI